MSITERAICLKVCPDMLELYLWKSWHTDNQEKPSSTEHICLVFVSDLCVTFSVKLVKLFWFSCSLLLRVRNLFLEHSGLMVWNDQEHFLLIGFSCSQDTRHYPMFDLEGILAHLCTNNWARPVNAHGHIQKLIDS